MYRLKAEGGMGFKDLQTLNMAMYAKQSWRVMNDETSLLHHVFKAKYFPNRNFMAATLGRTPPTTAEKFEKLVLLFMKNVDGESGMKNQ